MKRKSIKITAIILSVLIAAGGGYYGYTKYKSSKATVSTTNYITETVKKGQIDVGVQATGTIFAAVTKEIVTNNSGELKDLSVKAGDTVKSGDKLFKVESEQIKQQLTSAQINLEKQKLQLSKAQNDDEKTMQNLSLKEAQNNYNNVKQQYNNMVVKSPINGLVTLRNGNPGDNVQSGKSILTIIDTTSIKVKASVDELDIAKISKGQKVTVKLNAITDRTFEGTVETISDVGTTQNNVTSYDVIMTLNDTTGIKLGMTASVNIEIASKKDALLIPLEALTQRNGKKYVMAASTDSANTQSTQAQNSNNGQQAQKSSNSNFQRVQGPGKLVEVKTGLQNDNYVEVTEGLTEGQKVLVTISQGTTTTTNNRMRDIGGFGGGMPGGDMPGGGTRQTTTKQ